MDDFINDEMNMIAPGQDAEEEGGYVEGQSKGEGGYSGSMPVGGSGNHGAPPKIVKLSSKPFTI
jgi:hypothetical protein